jgi:hypothetical protein
VTTRALVPHGDGATQAAVELVARAELAGATVLRFEYVLKGSLGSLVIPERRSAQRAEKLWEHTCFEAFISPGTSTRYYELNFSPSTQWAAYVFDDYRAGMRPLSLDAPPKITVVAAAGELRVTAAVELAALAHAPWPWRVGLTAVVEETSGRRGYFALLHPRAKPDFHDAAGFAVSLDGSVR